MTVATRTTDSEPIAGNPASLRRARRGKPGANSILRQFLQCLVLTLLATASYFIISHFFLQSVKVVGRSMTPTLSDSQQYLLNRWVYYLHAPQASDVVVLRDPSDNGFSVKRVIATPGDSVYLKDGGVYVNGHRLEESYLTPGMQTFGDGKYRDELILCGRDQYFLLGDNRPNSIDSRTYGPVPRKNILGPIIR